ncbi:chemotaxis protein CheY [Paenarthrobacter sp. NPDC018779]|uniref:chemotaxis protein CheY n=1 Tax=Paenarthrobacter sp. NPDC018779 TaxID=3364375 RepID=UPI0037C8D8A5
MTSTPTSNPTPEEASDLLARAQAVGSAATASVSWPHTAFLVAFGASTSLGTLAMGLTTGLPYFVAMMGMMVWIITLMVFLTTFARSTKAGFKRRWGLYIGLWTASYAVAIVIASTSKGENIMGTCIGSALILLTTIACAWREARS